MKKFVTFIIPSIGRKTLLNSLNSLLLQENKEWQCIVGFDGLLKENIDFPLPEDDRIIYNYFSKKLGTLKGNGNHGRAGSVRNELIKLCKTEWIAFLDDDDTLTQDYVGHLLETINNNIIDCCIFRMIMKDGTIIPRPYNNNLYPGNIGISFACNLKFLLKNNITFQSGETEDFEFIKNIHLNDGKIYLSNNITYKVEH